MDIRKAHRETQGGLAEALNVSVASLSDYELNKRTPNIDVVCEIAKHYNVSVDYLVGVSSVASIASDVKDMKSICIETGLRPRDIETIKNNPDLVSIIKKLGEE